MLSMIMMMVTIIFFSDEDTVVLRSYRLDQGHNYAEISNLDSHSKSHAFLRTHCILLCLALVCGDIKMLEQ